MGTSEVLRKKSGVVHRNGRQRISHLGRMGSNTGFVKGVDAKPPEKLKVCGGDDL